MTFSHHDIAEHCRLGVKQLSFSCSWLASSILFSLYISGNIARPICLGTDHLTWRGVMVFSLEKYSDSQCCWKKYSDFGGGKKKSDSEFLSYNLMLNSGKKIF